VTEKLKATIIVKRSDLWSAEEVGSFEYKPETYREQILKLKEVLGRAHLE